MRVVSVGQEPAAVAQGNWFLPRAAPAGCAWRRSRPEIVGTLDDSTLSRDNPGLRWPGQVRTEQLGKLDYPQGVIIIIRVEPVTNSCAMGMYWPISLAFVGPRPGSLVINFLIGLPELVFDHGLKSGLRGQVAGYWRTTCGHSSWWAESRRRPRGPGPFPREWPPRQPPPLPISIEIFFPFIEITPVWRFPRPMLSSCGQDSKAVAEFSRLSLESPWPRRPQWIGILTPFASFW